MSISDRSHGDGIIRRLFSGGGGAAPDGKADSLEKLAVPEADALAAMTPRDDAEGEGAEGQQAPTRRSRPMLGPGDIVRESLAQKVLDAWLRNRQQTLYPLTMNFRTLEPGQAELLLHAMAAAMLADGEAEATEQEQVTRVLGEIGAGDGEHKLLAAALANPRPLSTLFRQIEEAKIAAKAYAASLIALNQRNAVNQLYLDYLAARLDIPNEVVASAARRYRM